MRVVVGRKKLDIESRIKEYVDEDVVKALKNSKNYNILEDERPSKVLYF